MDRDGESIIKLEQTHEDITDRIIDFNSSENASGLVHEAGAIELQSDLVGAMDEQITIKVEKSDEEGKTDLPGDASAADEPTHWIVCGNTVKLEPDPRHCDALMADVDLGRQQIQLHHCNPTDRPMKPPDAAHSTCQTDEEKFLVQSARLQQILAIPKQQRSHAEQVEYACLGPKVSRLKKRFPHLVSITPPLSSAERKRKWREKMSPSRVEAERDKARKRMATTENKDRTRQRMATPENKKRTRRRMATPENRERIRKRMATPYNKERTRQRLATAENKHRTRWRMATPANEKRICERMATAKKLVGLTSQYIATLLDQELPDQIPHGSCRENVADQNWLDNPPEQGGDQAVHGHCSETKVDQTMLDD